MSGRVGTEYELPPLPNLPAIGPDSSDEKVEAYAEAFAAANLAIMRQCRPGAVVTYPDGSRYKVAWKPHRSYICEASGTRWRVMRVRPVDGVQGQDPEATTS